MHIHFFIIHFILLFPYKNIGNVSQRCRHKKNYRESGRIIMISRS